jgi:hypothetical protein
MGVNMERGHPARHPHVQDEPVGVGRQRCLRSLDKG